MRGDRPLIRGFKISRLKFTPHARGSTRIWSCSKSFSPVYPACAGIDRIAELLSGVYHRLPRMRGDRPGEWVIGCLITEFTPHARGSTFEYGEAVPSAKVYPACAGIDPSSTSLGRATKSLPRMRGDRPFTILYLARAYMFTPHARGSTLHS